MYHMTGVCITTTSGCAPVYPFRLLTICKVRIFFFFNELLLTNTISLPPSPHWSKFGKDKCRRSN